MRKELIDWPLVTIGIVTYNQEKLLPITMNSVLTQGYPNVEIIISDDCSKDNTWQVIQSYKDPRIIATQNSKNLYQYANRNLIINKAKGKYIIFVDGDDILHQDGIEHHVRLLEEFPECGFTTWHFFRNNLVYPLVLSSHQFIYSEYFKKSFASIALAKNVFRVDTFKKIGGFPLNYITSDELARLNLAMEAPVLVTYHDPMWWRVTEGQQSSRMKIVNKTKEGWKQTLEVLGNSKCPLNEKEKEIVIHKIQYLSWRQVIKHFFMFKWKDAYEIYSSLNLKLKYFKKPNLTENIRNPFEGFTINNPMVMDYKKNPLSSN